MIEEGITVVNIMAYEKVQSEDKRFVTVLSNDLTPKWKNIQKTLKNHNELKRYRKWLKWIVQRKENKNVTIMLEYIDKLKLEN